MARQATEKAEAFRKMNRKHLRTLPDANVPDAQMSARALTIKTGDFASVFVRSITRTSLDRPFANHAGERPGREFNNG
jgi:hypothetical protein